MSYFSSKIFYDLTINSLFGFKTKSYRIVLFNSNLFVVIEINFIVHKKIEEEVFNNQMNKNKKGEMNESSWKEVSILFDLKIKS